MHGTNTEQLPSGIKHVFSIGFDLRNEPDRAKVTVTAIHSEYLKGEKKLWYILRRVSRKTAIVIRCWSCLMATGMSCGFLKCSTCSSLKGGFPQFADFLAKELVPWTRRNYYVTTHSRGRTMRLVSRVVSAVSQAYIHFA
jgi:hypothetical protein